MSYPASDDVVPFYRAFGFLVLRNFFDPDPLAQEIDRVLQDGLPSLAQALDYDGIHFQYVPMMIPETPASLELLDKVGSVAGMLLDGAVIPTRAKAVRYIGSTPWHTDSALALESVGFAAYLEPLTAQSGALRVIPGSHHNELGSAMRPLAGGKTALDLPGFVLQTEPGDMIVFDEHLFHSSSGGVTRRQWRADYLRTPTDSVTEERTRRYFADLYAADWDGGYDADRYPSYGPAWRSSSRPAVAQLQALGVYDLAAKQEEFMRLRRR
jgi:hypothetical protein